MHPFDAVTHAQISRVRPRGTWRGVKKGWEFPLAAAQVLQDRLGRSVANVENIRVAESGSTLQLSIDQRVQYLAYRELKSAVNAHRARSGALVMLDARTCEVIAMAGQPSYNPNNRSGLRGDYFRSRAVTDVFEPGSTIKPFTIAAALESGLYTPTTRIDTHPGFFRVGNHTIRDHDDNGVIDVATVIRKSSNVGEIGRAHV